MLNSVKNDWQKQINWMNFCEVRNVLTMSTSYQAEKAKLLLRFKFELECYLKRLWNLFISKFFESVQNELVLATLRIKCEFNVERIEKQMNCKKHSKVRMLDESCLSMSAAIRHRCTIWLAEKSQNFSSKQIQFQLETCHMCHKKGALKIIPNFCDLWEWEQTAYCHRRTSAGFRLTPCNLITPYRIAETHYNETQLKFVFDSET